MTDELDALQHEAKTIDAELAPPSPDGSPENNPEVLQAAQIATEQAEIEGILTIVSSIFMPVFPSLKEIYTADTIKSIASATVPVMVKHGWSAGAMLGKWAEELALAAVVLPVGFATYKGVQADIKAAEDAEKAKKAESQAASQPEIEVPILDPIVAERG